MHSKGVTKNNIQDRLLGTAVKEVHKRGIKKSLKITDNKAWFTPMQVAVYIFQVHLAFFNPYF